MKNKSFEGQLIRLFESVEGRMGSSYGAISSRSKVSNRELVRRYFESVKGSNGAGTAFESVEGYRFFPQPACELTEHL
jgi:hypothetical protein